MEENKNVCNRTIQENTESFDIQEFFFTNFIQIDNFTMFTLTNSSTLGICYFLSSHHLFSSMILCVCCCLVVCCGFLVLNKDAPFCGLNVKFLKVFFYWNSEIASQFGQCTWVFFCFFFLLMAECFHFCFFLANEISNKFEQVFFFFVGDLVIGLCTLCVQGFCVVMPYVLLNFGSGWIILSSGDLSALVSALPSSVCGWLDKQ